LKTPSIAPCLAGRHRFDAEFPAGAQDADGDLAAIGADGFSHTQT